MIWRYRGAPVFLANIGTRLALEAFEVLGMVPHHRVQSTVLPESRSGGPDLSILFMIFTDRVYDIGAVYLRPKSPPLHLAVQGLLPQLPSPAQIHVRHVPLLDS
jgi:hypothetical protein